MMPIFGRCTIPNNVKYVLIKKNVGSSFTYSTVVLRASRVQILAREPFPDPAPLSLSPNSLSVNSKLSCHTKRQKCQKSSLKKNLINVSA